MVEDDEGVRRAVAEMTRGLGYHVLRGQRRRRARWRCCATARQIDLLFTDVVMPGAAQRPDLARSAQQILPDLAVLFTSGYTENAIVHHGRLDEGVHLLSKPYREPELSRKLRAVLDEQRAKNSRRRHEAGVIPRPMPDPEPACRSCSSTTMR